VKLDPAWFGEVPCWVLAVELEWGAGREAVAALLSERLARTT
jgi:hypothetical protein